MEEQRKEEAATTKATSTAEDVGAALAVGVKAAAVVTKHTNFWRWAIVGVGFCFGVVPGILLLIYFAIEDNRRQHLARGYVAPGETIEEARWHNQRQREREREGR